MSELYGAFLRLEGRPCVVVGGGPVAERKLTGLLECGASILVIAPHVTNRIANFAKEGTIRWEDRPYQKGDVATAFLVIAATDVQDVNREVAAEAEQLGKLVNVVNDPTQGNFFVPALIRRGKLNIAVSTTGASPAVAKHIRQELEQHFGEEYAVYLERLADLRQTLLATVGEETQRTAIFQAVAGSDLLALLREGKLEEAERLIAAIIGGHAG